MSVREHALLARPRLNLMDGFRLERAGAVIAPPASGQRVLAVLAVRGEMTRAAAAGALWPEATDQHALGSLRSALWRLRGAGVDLVQPRRDTLGLVPTLDVDVQAFVAWAHRLIAAEAGTDGADLHTARIPGGELLPGWYEDWVLFERERLRQLRLHALEALATHLCQRGRYAAAIEAALEATRLEPFRESAHRILISVHLCEDNLTEALRHFSAYRQILHAELGVEPSTELQALLLTAGKPAFGPGRYDLCGCPGRPHDRTTVR